MWGLLGRSAITLVFAAALLAATAAAHNGGASGGGQNGGSSGPQYKDPDYTPAWKRNDMPMPEWQRKLMGGVSGPSSWQYQRTPVNDKIWQWRGANVRSGPTETHSSRKLLAGGPAAYQYEIPSAELTANLKQGKVMLPKEPNFEKRAGAKTDTKKPDGRALLAGGPAAYQYEIPSADLTASLKQGKVMLPKEPHFEKRAGAKTEVTKPAGRALLAGGPASHLYDSAVPNLAQEKVVLPKEPDFEKRGGVKPEVTKSTGRVLLDGDGGPNSWQRWGDPVNSKVWQWRKPMGPRSFPETHGSSRRLQGDHESPPETLEKKQLPTAPAYDRFLPPYFPPDMDGAERKLLGGVSGPSSWQYQRTPVNDKIWQWRGANVRSGPTETHSSRKLLAGGPAAYQYEIPSAVLTANLKQGKVVLPKEPDFEKRAGAKTDMKKPDGRALLAGGPAAYQYEIPSADLTASLKQGKVMLPKEPNFEKRAGAKTEVTKPAGRALLAGGPASYQYDQTRDSTELLANLKPGKVVQLPKEPDFENRFEEEQPGKRVLLDAETTDKLPNTGKGSNLRRSRAYIDREQNDDATIQVWQGKAAKRHLMGEGGPASWQQWGNPVNSKVWQWSKPTEPRPVPETHGGTNRKLQGEGGPASWQQWGNPVNSKVWQWSKPTEPRPVPETHGGTNRKLQGEGGPASWQQWGNPVNSKVWQWSKPTEPRPVPETHGGTNRKLQGEGGPASWQQWGNPVNSKVWQWSKPTEPRPVPETHGGTNRRLQGEGGPASWQQWGNPVNSKVWQWSKPTEPRPTPETHGSS